MEMKVNSMFEGQACYSKDDDDENIDPDIALSYIDEKLQHVLGHIQKDFEGVVSAENLGAKFGMYGSFLPTYERSSLALPHPKTVDKNSNTSKSLKDRPLEGASQNLKAPLDAPPIKTKDSCSVSIRAADSSTLKEETLNRSNFPANQNALKFRFKVPQNKYKRNAAIYSGLGLDDSPSSSFGDSPKESGVTPCTSQETMNESPTNILQVMTSSHVPGGVLVSPLHESLLSLLRREKDMLYGEGKPLPHLIDSQEDSASLLVEPVLSNIKQSGQKKNDSSGKLDLLVDSKRKNGFSGVNDKTLLVNKESENEITATASEITRETTGNGIREEFFCSNLTKPDSSESIAGSDSGKSKKWKFQICSGEKGLGDRPNKLKKDVSVDPEEKQRGKACKTSGPSKRKDDLRKKISTKAEIHTHEQINTPFERERPVPEGNKSKGNQSTENTALSIMHKATMSDGVSLSKSKIHKLKLKKDNNVRNNGDLLGTRSEQNGNSPKDTIAVDFETEQSTYRKSQKEMFNGTKAEKQLPRTYAQKAPSVVPCTTESVFASEGALAAVAPTVVNDNWVCCDSCQKWRLLPPGKTTEQLPEKWLCSMLDWLPGMNSCKFSEDETTQAVNGISQIPFAEGQANLQNNGIGTLPSNTLAYPQDYGINNPGNSQAISSLGKNHNLNENPKTGCIHGSTQMSISKKSQSKESSKCRILNKKAQLPVESNAMKKLSCLHNEEHTVGGESKQVKMTSKRGPDNYAFEGLKKNKKEDIYASDKLRSSDSDWKRVGFDSRLSIRASGEQRKKHDECSNSEDVKVDEKKRSVASLTKANQTQVSDQMFDRMNNAGKKRKLKEGQEIQNGYGFYLEDNIESGSRKEKKQRVPKIEVKQSLRNDANDVTNKRVKVNSVDGADIVKGIGKAQELLKHTRKNASQKPLCGISSSIRHSVTEPVSRAAASSSSKASGSHKTRGNFEEPKDSPVGSVSSSPMRISKEKDDAVDGDVPGKGNGRRCWKGQGADNLGQSGMEKEVKVFPDVAKEVISQKDRVDDRVNVNMFFAQGSGGDSSLLSKKNGRSSLSEKMKSGMLNKQVDSHSKKSRRLVSETDVKDHSRVPGAVREDKFNIVDDSGIKSSRARKISKAGPKSPLGQFPGDCGMKNQLRKADNDELDAKSAELFTNQKIYPKENVIQEFGSKSKVTEVDSESNMPESFSHYGIESKQETEDPCRLHEAQQGVVSDLFSGNSETPNVLLKQPTNAGTKSRAHHNVNQNMLNPHVVRGINLSSPGKINSSGQTATDALEEAKSLKDRAEIMKTSSFGFESNESFFDAALKFLHGASLLETSSSESGRHWEINQVQAYSTAAKLCESCGQEYEKRGEMATAALAYKCMEVAFMRIVFCKHSTCNRDRKELLTTISMAPQVLGESPSSSVSDVDNLNNIATAEKATFSKGAVSLVSGTHPVVARNRSSFVRLLDFTQDVISAMEALTKSKNAFEAAKLILEGAGKRECITSVRKVIDFSFQDVEGLICLVQLAKEAICRSGLRWC